ncbi:MAG: GPR endopeptidase [Clostridia bacterium]|nr:GPR endopeptidase [Clostridia bacterium]
MFRTDMARELYDANRRLEGVSEECFKDGQLEVSRIVVESEAAAGALGQPRGRYVTIELPEEASFVEDTQASIIRRVAEELSRLMEGVDPEGELLVLGLGNRFVTPDSLGPRTVDKIFVTRHIRQHVPEAAPAGMRSVSAVAPGVLGTTGMETVEIVMGLIDRTRPAALLCIDALASRRADRISASIQINDTGIQPGAGVHNRRAGITEESMGIPVFAIGVPTVVDANTIIGAAVERLVRETGESDAKNLLGQMAEKLMPEQLRDLVVTPKEIDTIIESASRRLAEGINRALHGQAHDELRMLLQN